MAESETVPNWGDLGSSRKARIEAAFYLLGQGIVCVHEGSSDRLGRASVTTASPRSHGTGVLRATEWISRNPESLDAR